LDAKIVEGFFVGLPKNKKGYMVLEHGNLQRVMMSCNVTFFKAPGKSERVRVQVEERPEDLKKELSEVERAKAMPLDSEHQTESESEGSEVCREAKLVDTQEKAVKEPTGELQKLKHTRQTPTRDDDSRFSMMSYSKGNLSGKTKVPPERAFIINDPITYEEAMSRSDATHWKRACTEEMEEFV